MTHDARAQNKLIRRLRKGHTVKYATDFIFQTSKVYIRTESHTLFNGYMYYCKRDHNLLWHETWRHSLWRLTQVHLSCCGCVVLAAHTLTNRLIQCLWLAVIAQELCESRLGGRPGLSVLTSLLASVDVKNYWTVLRHWSQLVPNMSTDIWGH